MSEETTKIILENIQENVEKINEKLDKMELSQNCLREDFIRHDEQIKMIKERNDRKDKEVIEIISKNDKEHGVIKDKFDGLNIKMAIYAGAIGVIAFLAQYLFKFLTK